MLDRRSGAPHNASVARLGGSVLILGIVGCGQTGVIEARFSSPALQSVVSEVRTFAFQTDERVNCRTVDPRGLGPGDATTRTSFEALVSKVSPPKDELIANFSSLPVGATTVVMEAWGPPCEEIGGSSDQPICRRLRPEGEPILRGYWCQDLELRSGSRLDLVAILEPFAMIGATLEIPSVAPSFDPSNPLFVADGLPAPTRFAVRVLDHVSAGANDVKVHFEVLEGAGLLVEPQPTATGQDLILQDDGLASATLQPSLAGSQTNSGRIVVRAHAPGYEGSPLLFYAQAVPTAEVTLQKIQVPRALVDLASADGDLRPVLVEDLDGDGNYDLVTIAGLHDHRLLVAYANSDQSFSVHVSEPLQGQVWTMASAALGPGPRTLLVSVADAAPVWETTPDGDAFVLKNPRIEFHPGLRQRPAGASFAATPAVVSSEGGTPMNKVPVEMDAQDVDGDGVDELALSRCSYVYRFDGLQYAPRCNARLSDKTDSEVALLRITPG